MYKEANISNTIKAVDILRNSYFIPFIRSVLCALEHLDVICIEIVLDMKNIWFVKFD